MMRALLIGVILVLAVHPGAVRAAKHLDTTTCEIVAFGDSITWGAYASYDAVSAYAPTAPPSDHVAGSNDTSYPGDLAHSLHVHVCNYGIPGELAMDGRPRFSQLLNILHPRVITLMEGVNDLPSGRADSAILADLAAMVAAARKAHVHPVLATLTPTYYPKKNPDYFVDDRVEDLNLGIRVLAKKDGIMLADAEKAFLHDRRGAALTKHGASEDFLHPNDAGYRLLADVFASVIRKHGLIPAPKHSSRR